MKRLHLLSIVALLLAGCASETTPNTTTNTEISNDDPLSSSAGTGTSTLTCPVSTCYYTGYDANNVTDFSILIPSFRNATVNNETDQAIAVLTTEVVTLQENTIEELIQETKDANPNFTADREQRLRQILGGNHQARKIVPTGAGITYFEMTRPGPPTSAFGDDTEKVGIIVNQYTADQISAGLTRYNSGQGDTLTGCINCHASGASGAPPHELGSIMELTDEEALQWIETGNVKGRIASIPHTWTFNDTVEREGIVPYLRSLQTKNLEEFTTLMFEEVMTNGLNGAPPP